MDGIHKNFRDQIFQQQYVLGEARGGTSVPDVAVDGTSVSYQGIVNQALNAESPGITNFGNDIWMYCEYKYHVAEELWKPTI